jgi:hypothetical protein
LFRTRTFWLGALAAAVLLVPVAIVAALLAGGGDQQQPAARAAAANTADARIESEVQKLRRQTQTRDKQQVEDLTARMRRYADELTPLVTGVARTLPPERRHKVGPVAGSAQVEEWRRRTRAAKAFFADSVSGETGTNVARGAFGAAVNAFAEVAESYKLALDNPGARAALFERVRAQRDLAMRAWETASVQMDAINIAVGSGHQHVPSPGGGGTLPDDLPEGSGATEPGEH